MSEIINQIKIYGQLHTEIISKMTHKKYCFNTTETYVQNMLNNNINNVNKIYWDEILLRAHFASVTSIMRNEKWINGMIMSSEARNFILFVASLRGFVESVTDSYYSLLNTPFDIASNFNNIKPAINGNLDQILVSEKLEETLIHFQFASKKNKSCFDYNKPLPVSKYIALFDQYSDIDTKKLYSKLCEIVHPAADSISCFITTINDSENYEYTTTNTSNDSLNIENIVNTFSNAILNLLKMAINAPVVCLKVLNLFDYELVQSEYLNSCLINKLIYEDAWNEILKMVEESKRY